MSVTTEHLEQVGIDYDVLPDSEALPDSGGTGGAPTMTDDGLAVRTVVLDVRTGHALAVLPADRELALERVREALDSRHVDLATTEEIAADYPEFSPETVPPLGDRIHTPVVVDEHVTDHEMLTFADGDGGSARVRVRGRDLFERAQIQVAEICAPR